jgi:hypothetical protein
MDGDSDDPLFVGVPHDHDGKDPTKDKDDVLGEVFSLVAAPHGVNSEGADANRVLAANLRSDA